MVLIPGSNYGVVANANILLTHQEGSLVPVDLTTKKLVMDSALDIPNFSGFLTVDPNRSRIYVPDRGNDALLIYDYAVGGSGVTMTAVDVPDPQDLTTNGCKADDNPFDVALVPGATAANDFLFVTNNLSGSVTMIPAESLEPKNLNPDESLLNGRILISASNFRREDQKPGRGANRLVAKPDGSLLFITSTQTNDIYVIDTADRGIEAMIDLSTLAATVGTRDMVIATNQVAYVVHRGLYSVIAFDVSGVVDNGIDYEVVSPSVLAVIPVGKSPQGIALSPDEQTLYVTNQGDNALAVIDVPTLSVTNVLSLPGQGPGQIVVDAARDSLYILNFISNDITVMNLTTNALETIE